MLIKEKSCGMVVLNKNEENIQVLLVQNKSGKHWSFPKGHMENNETEHETAKREVMEETGLRLDIENSFRYSVSYSPKRNVLKDVVYFLAFSDRVSVTPQPEEISDIIWCDISSAVNRITFDADKTVLRHALYYYQQFLSVPS